jgi:hypothetical protein
MEERFTIYDFYKPSGKISTLHYSPSVDCVKEDKIRGAENDYTTESIIDSALPCQSSMVRNSMVESIIEVSVKQKDEECHEMTETGDKVCGGCVDEDSVKEVVTSREVDQEYVEKVCDV